MIDVMALQFQSLGPAIRSQLCYGPLFQPRPSEHCDLPRAVILKYVSYMSNTPDLIVLTICQDATSNHRATWLGRVLIVWYHLFPSAHHDVEADVEAALEALRTFCLKTAMKKLAISPCAMNQNSPSSTTLKLFDFPCTIDSKSFRFAPSSSTFAS